MVVECEVAGCDLAALRLASSPLLRVSLGMPGKRVSALNEAARSGSTGRCGPGAPCMRNSARSPLPPLLHGTCWVMGLLTCCLTY